MRALVCGGRAPAPSISRRFSSSATASPSRMFGLLRPFASARTSPVRSLLVRASHAEASAPTPTEVPRRAGVTDGKWNAQDFQAMNDALTDSAGSGASGSMRLAGMSLAELEAMAVAEGEKSYRGKQIHDAIYKRKVRSLDDIAQIPKAWREHLRGLGVSAGRSEIHHTAQAKDGTAKFLLRLEDGYVVETVGIPAEDASKPRLTVCVSSQVGCPMRCTFCATGKGGFARNLRPHEIVDQVLTVEEHFGRRVSNVVFMGMGEPLLNLKGVMAAHRCMNEDIGIGARNMTISTVGVPQAIMRLAGHSLQSTLAVSIHAPNQELRERLIPSARAYPIDALMEDCTDYWKATGRRVSFEYTLLGGVNDSPQHAHELADLLYRHRLGGHVNLIPYNWVDDSDYQVKRFLSTLQQRNVPASVRQTRGLEASAACGQLRNSFQRKGSMVETGGAESEAEA